jgi:AcrR family transcriptional regulator
MYVKGVDLSFFDRLPLVKIRCRFATGRDEMVRKTKEEAEKTRKDLIAAARTVFHECGVSRSTLEKIAKKAGVTRGALYWHFKDKAELFFAMREDVFAPMIERTDALLVLGIPVSQSAGRHRSLAEGIFPRAGRLSRWSGRSSRS